MNNELLSFNCQELRDLYSTKKYDNLSQRFIDILKFFEKETVFELNKQEQDSLDDLVHTFLFLFTQPDYSLGVEYPQLFIQLNHVVSNVVAMSSHRNTDEQINELLENLVPVASMEEIKDYNALSLYLNNFFKILTLYSARNTVKIDIKRFFDIDPGFASLWYYTYFFLDAYPSLTMTNNISEHIKEMDERLTLMTHILEIPYFVSSYYDQQNCKKMKNKINKLLQDCCKDIDINNNPVKNKIAVITGRWFPKSSIYKTYFNFINSLKDDYELTLIHLGEESDSLDPSIFQKVRYLKLDLESEDFSFDLESIIDNDFELAFFVDIGLNIESIYLANMRIAPIQVTGYAHSISTYGADIDYYIGGSEVELIENAESNYSERLVLIPGLGISPLPLEIDFEPCKESSETFIINCPWEVNKYNYQMLYILKYILKSSSKKLIFRFFPFTASRYNGFLPLKNELIELLGAEHVEMFRSLPYNQYIKLLTQGDMTLLSYPATGYNTFLEPIYMGKPVILFEGTHAFARLASTSLKKLGLNELIASNENDYIQKALDLIKDDDLRLNTCNKIRNTDLQKLLVDTNEPEYFKKAIDYLIRNHEVLKKEKSRSPIVITD